MFDMLTPLFVLAVFMCGVTGGMVMKTVWLINKQDIVDRKKLLERKAAFALALVRINDPLTEESIKERNIERLQILSFIEGQRTSGGWSTQHPKFVFEQLRIAIQNGVHAWDFNVKSQNTEQEVL